MTKLGFTAAVTAYGDDWRWMMYLNLPEPQRRGNTGNAVLNAGDAKTDDQNDYEHARIRRWDMHRAKIRIYSNP